jgi:hypothetical protein
MATANIEFMFPATGLEVDSGSSESAHVRDVSVQLGVGITCSAIYGEVECRGCNIVWTVGSRMAVRLSDLSAGRALLPRETPGTYLLPLAAGVIV